MQLRASVHVVFGVVLVALGCGRPTYHVTIAGGARSANTPDPGVHPDDRCHIIPTGCDANQDDGCPDAIVTMSAGCALDPQQTMLDDAARDLASAPRGTVVRVVSGERACAEVVRDALIQRGAKPRQVELLERGTGPDASFEVAAWSGVRCP